MVEVNEEEIVSNQKTVVDPATPTTPVVPEKNLSPETPSTDDSTLTPDIVTTPSDSSSSPPFTSPEAGLANGHHVTENEQECSPPKNAEAANADSSTTPGENEANADVQKSNGALTPAAETTETPEKSEEPSRPEPAEKQAIDEESQSTTEDSAEINNVNKIEIPPNEEATERNAENQTPNEPEAERFTAAEEKNSDEKPSPEKKPEAEVQSEVRPETQAEPETVPETKPDVEEVSTDSKKSGPDVKSNEQTNDVPKTPETEERSVSSDGEKTKDNIAEHETPSQPKEQVSVGQTNETPYTEPEPSPEPAIEEITKNQEETPVAAKVETSAVEIAAKNENESSAVDSSPKTPSAEGAKEKLLPENSHLDVWMGDVDSQKTKELAANEKFGTKDEEDGDCRSKNRGNQLSVIKEKEERSEQEEIGGQPEQDQNPQNENAKEATEHRGNGMFETSLRTERKRKGAKAGFDMSQCCSIL